MKVNKRLKRFCSELVSKEGFSGSICDDVDVLEAVARVLSALDEKFEALNEFLDEILVAIDERDVGSLSRILSGLLDELVEMISEGHDGNEVKVALRALADTYDVEYPEDLDTIIDELTKYELFLEEIKRLIMSARDALRAKLEQSGRGL